MSITAETAKAHANDPAVLCCRFKTDDELAAEEAPAKEEAPAEAAPAASVQGAVTTIKHGKVVISIKEGKDIYLELPI